MNEGSVGDGVRGDACESLFNLFVDGGVENVHVNFPF